MKLVSQAIIEISEKELLYNDAVDNNYSSYLTMKELDLNESEYLNPLKVTFENIMLMLLIFEI